MKYTNIILLFALITILLTACSTDIDINGDYKETTIVYGILDPNQEYQYIRINRAFLGEGNALAFAQVPDSTLYPYLLDITIQGVKNEQVMSTSLSTDTIMVYKESDLFFTGYQPIYRVKMPFVGMTGKDSAFLNKDYEYRLTITNPVTGKIIESSTPIISHFIIDKPVINPMNPLISFSSDNVSFIEWKSPKNGRRFEGKIEFTFYEVYDANPNDTIVQKMTWKLGTLYSNLTNGGEEMTMSYNNKSFYYLISQQFKSKPDVKRYPGNVDLFITVGSDELSTYMDVNSSSNTIIQEKPQFTNISGGLGIFASKYILKRTYKLNASSIDTLREGQHTKYLNFQGYLQ